MTQQALLDAGYARLVGAINAVHNLHLTLAGNAGVLTALNTTDKASLVAAINEVKAAADAAASGGVSIDDSSASSTSVWSSSKTQTEITGAVVAALEGEDLSDIAASISALAAADQGLVSADAAQSLTAAQQLQACQNIDIGDPTHDYVPAIAGALNAGL